MIGETQQQQAPASADLDFSTITPIDSGKPANAGSTLRQSVAYGVQQNPDDYAKLLKQQQLTGMSPEAAKPFANDTQNAIDVERLNPEGMVDSHPRTAQWATNPDNAAVSGADELHRLTRIEQHAASMRAYTPTWEDKVSGLAQSAYEFLRGGGSQVQLKQRAFEYPLGRVGVGALRGTAETLGNVGSFFGIHGDNPGGLNWLQRKARTLEPVQFGEEETGLDKLAANVGPMVPALFATGGTSLIARTLGLSDKAAKVLAGLSVGGMFTADQGGRTYNAMREQGASDYDARIAANRVAAINAPANALFGATEVVPIMRDNPFLSSLGLGAATGTTGQVAQNVVTGRPLTSDLGQAAVEGAAVQGGMHLGMSFAESMHATVAEVADSQLRARSQEKFEQAVNQIFEGDSSLRIPAQDFVNYFVGKDIDPSVVASRVGVKNLTEAAAAGADLEIPKANYFARLDPEHQKGLLQDLIDPSTEMTARQAEAGRQELSDWVSGGGAEKLQADFAAADAETQATPEWQKVYTDLKQRYVDAGEAEPAADSYATLQANAIANLAKRAGLKPDELLALHNPQIAMAEAPESVPEPPAPIGEEGEVRLMGEPLQASIEPVEGSRTAQAKLADLALDPQRFQYKLNTDAAGVTNLLKGRKWNQELADPITVWRDPEDGKTYVVNGHHRYALAKENGVESLDVKYTEAVNAKAARAVGALQNIAAGRGTAMDAAKFFRDSGMSPHELDAAGISMGEATAAKGVALARLDTHIFDQVVSGKIREGRAVAIGNATGDAAEQESLLKLIQKAERKGKRVTDDVVDELARMVKSAGRHTETQENLFGAQELTKNLALEKADVSSAIREKIATERRVFQSVSQDSKAKELGKVKGQKINAKQNAAIAEQASQAAEVYDKLSTRSGPIDDILNNAAKELASGENANAVKERAYTAVRDELAKALARGEAERLERVPETPQNSGAGHGVGTLFQRRVRPQDSFSLPGMEGSDAEREAASAAQEGASLTDEMRRPLGSIDGAAGEMERNSPLFFGSGDNRTLFQGDEPRGWFRILPDGRYEIGKTKLGDFSTFVHEPAHAYLELFRELTQREGASDELKLDFKKIADWLGTTPEDAYKNGFTREQHEQWARANEEYVREGKAPTSGLQRAFQNFSVWLGSIYRRAGALGVEMSSEIRGVMDRLYAGEEAVNRAEQEAGREQLFETPEEAGWTEQEFRNYARGQGVEEAEARKLILSEMRDAAKRERTEVWREEKSGVREAVTAQVDARPEYRAIRSLRKGALDDGTDLTLNREALVKQFGEERVKDLQRQHRGLYRQEGGVDAETAAELLGFGSGEEMMRALEKAPRRGLAIEQAVRDTMTARHGDIRYDGSLDDRARLAVENNERAKNVHKELAALRARVAVLEKRAADSKAAMRSITIEPLEHYQEAARQMIDDKAIADLQPHRYLTASRKFSREAFEALRKGNVKAAADAKNKELLNHFLFREASAARDYVEKFEKYTQRVQSKGIQQRLGLADENAKREGRTGDYRDQFNWLMARYRLGGAPQSPERSLRDWADDVYGQGNEPAIEPSILDGHSSRIIDYRNAPLSEVRNVHDALINIRHLAQQEFKMFVQGKQVKFAEAKQSMIESARTNLKSKPEQIFEENLSRGAKLLRGLEWVDSRLIRMERLVEWLDGGKAGSWHDHLWNLASDAQGDEYGMQEKVTKAVTDALENMPDEMRKRLWTEKVSVEGIGEPITRRRMLSMAFNMGNEGNLDRLRKTFDSFGWDRGAIEKIGGMLTREEWSFVQRAWESLKPMGVRMQDLERRLTGLPPQMVKVTPFKVVLEDGAEMELGGGYFPIVMDPRFSERAIQQDAQQTAQNAMQSGYVRATTSKGYTKERTGFGGPLLLDYEQVLTSHVSKVAKDLSHREFMLASQRFLLDTEVRKTLRETLGPAYEKQFMPWLRTIINDNNGSVQERLDGLKDGMQKLRGNIVSASLGFNASTSLLQISHAPRMLLYAKPASLAQAFVDLLAHPFDNSREIKELSPSEMRFRGDNLDRDIRAVLQEPTYQAGYTRKVAVAARFALEMMDHLLSHTLWKAAYRDALDKYADLPIEEAQPKAVHEADSAVRLGLGTSAPKDLPAIMRSNEFNKFITTLYGFHNGVYNQLRDIGHQFGQDHKVGKATVAGLLTVIVPAVLGNLLTGRGPGSGKKEEGESAGAWAAKKSLIFAADTVPILRSLASAMEGGHDVQFSPIENVLQKGAKTLMDATSEKENKDWLGIGLNAGEFGGEVAGVPGAHQMVKTLRYIKRVHEGKVQNPNIWNAVVGGGR